MKLKLRSSSLFHNARSRVKKGAPHKDILSSVSYSLNGTTLLALFRLESEHQQRALEAKGIAPATGAAPRGWQRRAPKFHPPQKAKTTGAPTISI